MFSRLLRNRNRTSNPLSSALSPDLAIRRPPRRSQVPKRSLRTASRRPRKGPIRRSPWLLSRQSYRLWAGIHAAMSRGASQAVSVYYSLLQFPEHTLIHIETALHEIKHQQKDGVAEGAILQWIPFARLVRDVMLDIPTPDGNKWRIQIEALDALRFACEQMVQNQFHGKFTSVIDCNRQVISNKLSGLKRHCQCWSTNSYGQGCRNGLAVCIRLTP